MDNTDWLMRVEGTLAAHFKQGDGTSRPGTDWSVGLKRGNQTFNVMVRAYLSDDMTSQARADEAYQWQTVMGYLYDLIQQGWHPDQPPELAIIIQNPTPGTTSLKAETPTRKSRWRFW